MEQICGQLAYSATNKTKNTDTLYHQKGIFFPNSQQFSLLNINAYKCRDNLLLNPSAEGKSVCVVLGIFNKLEEECTFCSCTQKINSFHSNMLKFYCLGKESVLSGETWWWVWMYWSPEGFMAFACSACVDCLRVLQHPPTGRCGCEECVVVLLTKYKYNGN